MNRGDPALTKKAILKELFGSEKTEDMKMSNVQLPKHPGKDLKEKKLISLAKKYGSIPADKISYYPAPTAEILAKLEEQKQIDSDEETIVQIAQRHKRHKGASEKTKAGNLHPIFKEKKKVGRPKNATSGAGVPTILQFFQLKTREALPIAKPSI